MLYANIIPLIGTDHSNKGLIVIILVYNYIYICDYMYKYIIYCPNLMYNKLPSVVDYQILNCDHNALSTLLSLCDICHQWLPSSHTVYEM